MANKASALIQQFSVLSRAVFVDIGSFLALKLTFLGVMHDNLQFPEQYPITPRLQLGCAYKLALLPSDRVKHRFVLQSWIKESTSVG